MSIHSELSQDDMNWGYMEQKLTEPIEPMYIPPKLYNEIVNHVKKNYATNPEMANILRELVPKEQ